MQISFKVNGMEQLNRNLRLLVTDMKNLRDFFKDALNIIVARSDEVFNSGGSVVEKAPAWPPLAPSTMKARDRRWGYYRKTPNRPSTLRWTGNLQDNRTMFYDDSKGTVTWNAPYAIYHQAGGTKLPQRVIIDLSNPTNAEIVRALQMHVNRVVGIFGRQV